MLKQLMSRVRWARYDLACFFLTMCVLYCDSVDGAVVDLWTVLLLPAAKTVCGDNVRLAMQDYHTKQTTANYSSYISISIAHS